MQSCFQSFAQLSPFQFMHFNELSFSLFIKIAALPYKPRTNRTERMPCGLGCCHSNWPSCCLSSFLTNQQTSIRAPVPNSGRIKGAFVRSKILGVCFVFKNLWALDLISFSVLGASEKNMLCCLSELSGIHRIKSRALPQAGALQICWNFIFHNSQSMFLAGQEFQEQLCNIACIRLEKANLAENEIIIIFLFHLSHLSILIPTSLTSLWCLKSQSFLLCSFYQLI